MWGAQSLTCSSTQSCYHHPHTSRTFPVCEATVDLLWNVFFSSTFRFFLLLLKLKFGPTKLHCQSLAHQQLCLKFTVSTNWSRPSKCGYASLKSLTMQCVAFMNMDTCNEKGEKKVCLTATHPVQNSVFSQFGMSCIIHTCKWHFDTFFIKRLTRW